MTHEAANAAAEPGFLASLIAYLENPVVWYAAAVFLFVVLMFRVARKPLAGWLDGEIVRIRFELDEAKKLRAEAAATLEEYRRKQKEALQEAEGIIAHAKEEAGRMRAAAEADLKASLVRYEQKAEARIRLAETEALADVRAAVIDEAVAAAQKALATKLDASAAEKLADQAIAEVPSLTGSGPRAA